MNTVSRIAVALVATVALAACSKRVQEVPPVEEAPPPPRAEPAPAPDDGRYSPSDLETDACLRQRVVYFDFDQANVRPEFRDIMACHAKYLRDRSSARMTLEGHADERGTREYNLGLAERRGNAVRDALVANRASSGQMDVVSYGEERPVCTASDESCWQRNRRVEIVYTAQ